MSFPSTMVTGPKYAGRAPRDEDANDQAPVEFTESGPDIDP